MAVLWENVVRYRVGSFDRERWFRAQVLAFAWRRLRRKVRGRGPWEWRERGTGVWRGPIQRMRWLSRVVQRELRNGNVGDVLDIRCDDGTVWSCRKVRRRLVVPIQDTQGNSRVDRIYTGCVRSFRRLESWGICARRDVRGGSSPSQHNPWAGADPGSNAWDIHHDSPTTMLDVANFLVRHRQELEVGRVIYNRRIWDPVLGWHPYSGVNPHTDHIHAEGSPQREPPIQASCG